ncbi:MAG TPA: thiol:disulfide interchange protein, partial [Chromatiaceae bacterium]|nr:thiol:disulfide interchange protein [Chromatiaceae bacterium]
MYRLITILLLGLASPILLAEEELLKPDQAFKISSRMEGDNIVVRWDIADGYYLYRSKFHFDTSDPGVVLGNADLPPGKIKQDPFFGELEIFRDEVEAVTPVRTEGGKKPEILELSIRSQGCADIGICYPPHTQTLLVALDNSADEPPPVEATAVSEAQQSLEQFAGSPIEGANSPVEPADGTPALQQLAALGDALGLEDEDDILPPDMAYQVVPRVIDGRTLVLDFKVANGTYLYEDKLQVEVEGEGLGLGELELPKAKIKPDTVRPDGTIGDVAVFVHDFQVRVPLIRTQAEATTARLTVKYQGCAERGICYPPQKKSFDLDLPAVAETDQPDDSKPAARAAEAPAPPAVPETVNNPGAGEQSEQDQIA